MKVTDHIERESHRLIITRRNGSEILFSSNGLDWSLPWLEILSKHRVAEQLTEKLQVECGLQAYYLLDLRPSGSDRTAARTKYAVMESLHSDERAPAGSRWFPITGRGSQLVVPSEDNAAITRALLQTNSNSNDSEMGPFARLGWLKELRDWVQTQIDPLGLRLTGAIRQLNASPSFSLMRLETTGPAVWFKATGEPNRHELSISLTLARLFPRHVASVLGFHLAWNGWVSEEALGTPLHHHKESCYWASVARALAELQIDSIGKCNELLGNHCKDLRLAKIEKLVDPFLARMTDLMATQQKQVPAPLTNPELSALGDRLRQACSLLQDVGFPDTLGHLDLNPHNIVISPARSVFLDWAEGCVTNPLIAFEYFREHFQRNCIWGTQSIEMLATAYTRPWRTFFSPDALKKAMAISPLVAVFAYAVRTNTWQSPEALVQPSVAGYFRGLARRMHRETVQTAERSEPCLA
jgi:hypothetical protein